MRIEPFEITVVINRTPNDVFDAFVSKLSDWWPLETHSIGPGLGEAPPSHVVVEPDEGGRIYEVSQNGEARLWGRIKDYEPGKAISFTWHPGLDGTMATFVSVRFQETDANRTAVTLVHDGWDARGDDAERVRENYVTGWSDIIRRRFAEYVSQAK